MNDIPQHIAFIMDGNGRWAKMRALPRSSGHKEGLKTAENVIDLCIKKGIGYISLYVFSTENWKRPRLEIDALFALADEYLERLGEFASRGVRIVVSGDPARLPAKLAKKIAKAQEETAAHDIITLNLCINYGGQHEIVHAANALIEKGVKNVTMAQFASCMYNNLPPPDLIIRTGGQMRLSNFLLFQAAYSELYFCDTLWPDFGKAEFDAALEIYTNRIRKFGGI